jgi:hypothetical protein
MTTTAPVSNCTVIYQLGDRLIRPTEKQERRGLIRVGVGATFEVAYVASTCERAVAGARHRIQIRSAAGAGERLSVTMTGIGIGIGCIAMMGRTRSSVTGWCGTSGANRRVTDPELVSVGQTRQADDRYCIMLQPKNAV